MPALISSSQARARLWSADPEDFSLGDFNDQGNSRLSTLSTGMNSNGTMSQALESNADSLIQGVATAQLSNNMIPSLAWYLSASMPTPSPPSSSRTYSLGVLIANANDEVRRRIMPRYWEFCQNYGTILYLWARGFSSWTTAAGTPHISTIQDLNSLLNAKNGRSIGEAVELLENYFRERVASHPQYKVHPNSEDFPPMLEPFCKMLAKVEMVPERTLWARLIDYHTGLSISSIAEGFYGDRRRPATPEYLSDLIEYRPSDIRNEDEDEIPSVISFSLSPPRAPIRSPILQEERYSPDPPASREYVQLSVGPSGDPSWPMPTSRSFPHPPDTVQPVGTPEEGSNSSSEDYSPFDFGDLVNLVVMANISNQLISRRRVPRRTVPSGTWDNGQWRATTIENENIPIRASRSFVNANFRTISPEVLHSINPHTSSPARSPILARGAGYQAQLSPRDVIERATQEARENHTLRTHVSSSVNHDFSADTNVESNITSNNSMPPPANSHSNSNEAASRPRQWQEWRTLSRSSGSSTYRYRSRRSISYRAIAPRRLTLEAVVGRNRRQPTARDMPQEELHILPPASQRMQNQGPSAVDRENDLMNAFLHSAQSRRRENVAEF